MKLNFTPVNMTEDTTIIVEGDVLYIDGYELDFGPVPEGAVLPMEAIDCKWIQGDVTRKDGHIELTISLPHGPNATDERRNPQPILVVEDGVVALPPFGYLVTEEIPDDDQLFTDENEGTVPA